MAESEGAVSGRFSYPAAIFLAQFEAERLLRASP
jgi:hypothetical protein